MTSFTVEFVLTKATPGTHKYDEIEVEGQPLKIGSLYVKKTSLPADPPKVITGVFSHGE